MKKEKHMNEIVVESINIQWLQLQFKFQKRNSRIGDMVWLKYFTVINNKPPDTLVNIFNTKRMHTRDIRSR